MKIEAKQLKEALDGGRVRLVDVRTPAEFGEMHIAGSELMPLDRLEADRLKGNGKDCVIVCRSGKRAEQARQMGRMGGCHRGQEIAGLSGFSRYMQQSGRHIRSWKTVVPG